MVSGYGNTSNTSMAKKEKREGKYMAHVFYEPTCEQGLMTLPCGGIRCIVGSDSGLPWFH
jgi:hypothetical protein